MVINQSENNRETEIISIKKAIMDFYHEGHAKSDPELYKNILHDEWKFFLFDENDQLKIVDKEEYISRYKLENVNKDLTWNTEFYNVDVTGKNAAVKLRIECEEVGYIDYFNLMKINDIWWIVHKLSHKIK
ncbi:MAG: nuclear transport factor 2 family protein [Candidatus Lokiarchaeota archaeon]|nr:nuclear transport factor 2 family protein [Candidatus Lokiarchaeota archaeon]